MAELNDYGVVYETDVLVVGGGMSGLSAAISAKDQDVDVLVVEEMNVGFAGMAPRAGNGILSLKPDDDIEEYVSFLVKNLGKYLTDQDALRRQAKMINPSLYRMRGWGVILSEDENGDIGYWSHVFAPWRNTGIDVNCVRSMKETALKKGVRIKNHVSVTGLMKDENNTVIGAVGFDLKDGHFYVLRAKAVILACSGCGFRSTRMFNGKGEGIKIAWDAGAQMRNAEYGNMYEVSDVASGESVYGTCSCYISPMWVYNQKGENLWKKYVKWPAPDTVHEIILGMEKEVREGNGPCYIDMEKLMEETDRVNAIFAQENAGTEKQVRFFPEKLKWYMGRVMQREGEYFEHQDGNPVVVPAMHGNMGCVKVDINMKTSLEGLYAVGLDSCGGSAAYGAIPQPFGQRGNGLGMASVTGMIGGEEAGKFVKSVDHLGKVSTKQLEELKEAAYAPMKHSGDIDPHDLVERIQDAYTPLKYSMRRSEESLKESLAMIESVKADLPKMRVDDYHGLLIANQTIAMTLCAEIAQNAALARKESRGFHFREDYPETDNENWLKWVIVQNVDGKLTVSTEDIPIDKYEYRPDNMYQEVGI